MAFNDTCQIPRFLVAAQVPSKKWYLFQYIFPKALPMQAADDSRISGKIKEGDIQARRYKEMLGQKEDPESGMKNLNGYGILGKKSRRLS